MKEIKKIKKKQNKSVNQNQSFSQITEAETNEPEAKWR